MSLKELTMKQHHNAERQKFAGVLMSGKITKDVYMRYLVNQHHCYSALENHSEFKLPDDRLKRSDKIRKDIEELLYQMTGEEPPTKIPVALEFSWKETLKPSTLDYGTYVEENIKTYEQFMAHVYVRYLGDLRGGQMISKKIPGSGKYYEFDKPEELAQSIYIRLNDDMVDEAKKVFEYATKLFIEMYEEMDTKKI
jgi:heme oxygenase